MRPAIARLSLISLTLLLAACQTSGPVRDINYAPVRPVTPPPAPSGNGSIYQGGHEVSWFEDMRARRVGDLLTVILSESTSANKSAKSGTKKSNSNTIANPTIFGSTPQFNTPGLIPLASNDNNTLAFSTSAANDFKGEGSASQSNAITGNITVSVIEVLPNRNLMIRGEKRIGINQGNEYIRLSGIVRSQDISPENQVESSRIADPTIIYVGDGQLADSNAMGWLAKFFISPIFPF
ncbi:flagellar basal body L-ring protein FlgH [Candidatus Endoriftia persephone]|jgi:flagellar L-ring protein precursor FlgH|uniref:Flagellar L-ring protein n=3 Tax=Gammaproteobacteria TaxID=1236 RepID=G2FB46_9GAMM|nr:flagellar basal body L-ring protein FlgH [Candidatus Endoriftia persephone]EGV51084.1 flagellar L-ring protein [endosymbiont of Riftia pachyptila (vent Ph05)]EGW55984.1 flagellar L-ring protein FlgH [endosymbiont of Tevnia jerichonana (vent Tica)]USF88114.1 flagellar basal body L-ring protein FlgH [Candidatus Endoriftia persephone]